MCDWVRAFLSLSQQENQPLTTTSFEYHLSRVCLLFDIVVIFCFQYHESEIIKITWWNLKVQARENKTSLERLAVSKLIYAASYRYCSSVWVIRKWSEAVGWGGIKNFQKSKNNNNNNNINGIFLAHINMWIWLHPLYNNNASAWVQLSLLSFIA